LLSFEIAIRFINGFFTIGIGLALAFIYVRKRARFLSLSFWSLAFLVYGIQILTRVWYSWNSLEVFLLSISMTVFLVMGASNLIGQNKIYATVLLAFAATGIFLFPSLNWYKYGAYALFGLMTVAAVHLRLVMGKLANRFIVGWLTLLIVNAVFVATISIEWVADLAAIPAKALLALGMFDQRFARMMLDIRQIYKAYRKDAGKTAQGVI